MIPHARIAIRTVAFFVVVALIPTCRSQALEQFRNCAAEVEVGKGANRPKENGTGFVVSVDGGTLSVLTARHLFYDGRDRFTDDISVTFYLDKLHPRKAVLLTDSPALDLAVLEV